MRRGTKNTDETKAKISATKMGHPTSQATKDKISRAICALHAKNVWAGVARKRWPIPDGVKFSDYKLLMRHGYHRAEILNMLAARQKREKVFYERAN